VATDFIQQVIKDFPVDEKLRAISDVYSQLLLTCSSHTNQPNI